MNLISLLSASGCLRLHKGFAGSQLSRFTHVRSVHTCSELCLDYSSCQGWVFHEGNATCSLFESIQDVSAQPGAVAAEKNCLCGTVSDKYSKLRHLPDVSPCTPSCFLHSHKPIGRPLYAASNVDTISLCQKLCRDNSICKQFSYQYRQRRCSLFTTSDTVQYGKANTVSGPPICPGQFPCQGPGDFLYWQEELGCEGQCPCTAQESAAALRGQGSLSGHPQDAVAVKATWTSLSTVIPEYSSFHLADVSASAVAWPLVALSAIGGLFIGVKVAVDRDDEDLDTPKSKELRQVRRVHSQRARSPRLYFDDSSRVSHEAKRVFADFMGDELYSE